MRRLENGFGLRLRQRYFLMHDQDAEREYL
jgi:hypothetical protein